MGFIQDRTRENLVSTDNGIIMTRQRLMRAAREVAQGVMPPGRDAPAQAVRAFSAVLPRNVPIADAAGRKAGSGLESAHATEGTAA